VLEFLAPKEKLDMSFEFVSLAGMELDEVEKARDGEEDIEALRE
jgi:hypothetical protein